MAQSVQAISSPSAPLVRVEAAESYGRTYSEAAKGGNIKRGLGAERALLRTQTFTHQRAFGSKKDAVVDSATMAMTHLSRATREEVLAYFHNTWDLTSTLFSALRDDSVFYMVPDKLRRPLIFYFAHPAALYINKCHQAGLVDHLHPYFQKLFETGVDEMSWDDMDAMQDGDFAWPDVGDTIAFRESVKAVVEDLIRGMPDPAQHPVTMDSPWWSLFLAFEHERIHLETSAVLIHQLPVDCVSSPGAWRTAPSFAPSPSAAPENVLIPVRPETVVLGKPRAFPSFGFDNEYGKRVVEVPAFSASRFLVSNAEFLPFVMAGGYEDKQWWVSAAGDDEGWRWRAFRNATHPSFWVADAHPDMARFIGGSAGWPYQKDDGNATRAGCAGVFKLRAMFDIIDMPWDWPVEVNYHESTAFLSWKAAQDSAAGAGSVSYRLPTEAEYHCLRGDPSPYPEATVGRGAGAAAGGGPANCRATRPLHADNTADVCDSACTGPSGTELQGADSPTTYSLSAVSNHALGSGGELDPTARVDVIMQPRAPGNVNMRWHSSSPVDMYAPSATGFHDTHGNVWEWTEDHFAPLPGFEIHYLYDDFSSPCFDGWHTVIMGGSWVSTGDLASSFARYHFRRHFFQHLGFRYVRVAAPEAYPGQATVTNLWEGQGGLGTAGQAVDAFGTLPQRVPSPLLPLLEPSHAAAYASNLARLCAAAYDAPASSARVLHLGCGVSGVSFELLTAGGFGAVLGVDNHEPSIRAARVFQHHGQLELDRAREGVLTDTLLLRCGAAPDARSRASFVLGDACELGPEVTPNGPGFDVVLVDGLLTRLTQPLQLLQKLGSMVRPGGQLVITSSNDWDPKITPRNSWLGGFKMNGEDMPTLRGLSYTLKRAFDLVQVSDIPRLARKNARQFSIDVMETSVWRRRA